MHLSVSRGHHPIWKRERVNWFVVAALQGFLAVAAGAFGAHKLKDLLEPRFFEVFQTASEYQFIHVFALMIAAWCCRQKLRFAQKAAWCFFLGTVVFSGSLYTLALTGMTGLGRVTPVGGVLLLVGWALLAAGFWKSPSMK